MKSKYLTKHISANFIKVNIYWCVKKRLENRNERKLVNVHR